jgi:hypothetical protein
MKAMHSRGRALLLAGLAAVLLAAASTLSVAAATGAFSDHRNAPTATGCAIPALPGAVVSVRLVDMRSMMGRTPMMGGRGPMMSQAAALAVLVPASAAGEVELHAGLHHSAGYPHASGSAGYHRDHDGRELEISVRVPGLAGRWVTVYAAGQRVGRLHLSGSGYGHRDWDSHHGARVPSCHAGSGVRVVRSRNGKLVASGVFYRHHHHNGPVRAAR